MGGGEKVSDWPEAVWRQWALTCIIWYGNITGWTEHGKRCAGGGYGRP